MIEKSIENLTLEELSNPHFIESIYQAYPNEEDRQTVLEEVLSVAKTFRISSKIKKEIEKYENSLRTNVLIEDNEVLSLLETTKSGQVLQTTNNYGLVFNNDPNIRNLFLYDVFSDKVLKVTKNGFVTWTDNDDSVLRVYLETNYGLYNQSKYYDAFNNTLMERTFHPIKNIIEREDWDGVPRIDNFLHDILRCPQDDYHREVSRMIFYGGISRLYNPGCKFDYMPILIGKQGCGKSSIIKWLALSEQYFTEINTIEGKEALEQLQGSWVCEFAELLAMVRTKDVEAMKGFISRTTDKYRQAYGRRLSEFPRQCIFVGTTNDYTFLVDKTGNRRYLPVILSLQNGDLFRREAKVKEYILQCWREALTLFNEGNIYLTIPYKYMALVEEAQASVLEDDPKVGLIEAYLDSKEVGDKVCGLEIFTKCLNDIKKNYGTGAAKEISRYMAYHRDWKRCNSTARFETYGVQKYWVKVSVDDNWSDLD
jgi:predicted P-loop ATPase